MRYVNFYLAHRNNTATMEQQVTLIRKFLNLKPESQLRIFGYVDADSDIKKDVMREKWISLGVTPIDIPSFINGLDRNRVGVSESFGAAATWIYENYIMKDTYISVHFENDVFPLKPFSVEEIAEGYEICGDVRFNVANLPDRMNHFWLGLIIFNHELMQDKETFKLYCGSIQHRESKKWYMTDSGAISYYWITEKPRKVRQLVTNGAEGYDGFTSSNCIIHNITHDTHLLPSVLRTDYHYSFRCLIYDDLFLHLERIHTNDDARQVVTKLQWWTERYNEIMGGTGGT
jgi:hypothetical protein